MHEIKHSETLPYTAMEMFELVADVDRYKEFLPWCTDSRILRRENDNVVVAEIQVGFEIIHTTFATRNTLRIGRAIEMDLVEGPFKFLKGGWNFDPMPEHGSRMSLNLRFEFSHHTLEASFSYMFEKAMDSMVYAFKNRAAELYEKGSALDRKQKRSKKRLSNRI